MVEDEGWRPFGRRALFAAYIALICIGAAQTAAAADISVGILRTYKTMAAGVAAAHANDRILLDPGVYLNDTATTNVPLTIEGAGPGVILRATNPLANRKGILVVNADLHVSKLTFEGAFISVADGNNGAGIRLQAGSLTVEDCAFNNNQDGILTNGIPSATVNITGSTFSGNGAGDGYSHAIYVNAAAQLTVSDSIFAGTHVGHDIKSRALKTTITNTVLDDGVTGTTSYAIDLPNGGAVVLDGVTITQGAKSENGAMVAYGAEGNLPAVSSLLVANSTFTNYLPSGSIGIRNFSSLVSATISNTIFNNVATSVMGSSQTTTQRSLHQGAVASTARSDEQSFLRFYNSSSGGGTVTVTLSNFADGSTLTTWKSPNIPAGAGIQIPIATIENAASKPFTKPFYYSLSIQAQFAGSFQHVLWRVSDGTFTNLSTCDSGVTAYATRLTNVHSSLVGNAGFPSSVVIYNTGTSSASATLGVYDSATGDKLGTYVTPSIPANAQIIAPILNIKSAAGILPGSSIYHYVIKSESAFSGYLQHLLLNQKVGVVTDMTTVCTLP